MKQCIIKNCINKHHSKGYCQKHYDKMRDHDNPYYNRIIHHSCIFLGCKNKHCAKGYCNKHYLEIYYKENLQKHKERCKKYYIQNLDKFKELGKKYRKNNVIKIKKYNTEWKKMNSEKVFINNKKYLYKLSKSFNIKLEEYRTFLIIWSKSIKIRDNHICQNCGSKNNLNAHHILYKQHYPELSLNINNGITLCKKCHEELHRFKIY